MLPFFLNSVDYSKEINEFIIKFSQGVDNLAKIDEIDLAVSKKELVLQIDRVKLYRYSPLADKKPHKVPLLIVYALVNRNSMLDLQEGRSLIRGLLKEGLDVYLIDWGDPTRGDRYLTLEDHIDYYLGECVDHIINFSRQPKINLLGVCQGGTFAAIYSALYPKKINTFIPTVTPIDFDHQESLLNVWAKEMDADQLVDTLGNVTGDFMNFGYQMLKPFTLNVQKYVSMVDIMTEPNKLLDFMRMEKWIFDSPDQPGETIRQFLIDFYQKNLLVKGKFKLGDKKVSLKNITMPVLVIYAEKDHLVPPCSAKPIYDLVGSKDKKLVSLPVGHIGLYVSSKTQATLPPLIAEWLKKR